MPFTTRRIFWNFLNPDGSSSMPPNEVIFFLLDRSTWVDATVVIPFDVAAPIGATGVGHVDLMTNDVGQIATQYRLICRPLGISNLVSIAAGANLNINVLLYGIVPTAAPSAPTLFAQPSDGTVDVTIAAVTGADSYKIEHGLTSTGPFTEVAINITSFPYNDTTTTFSTTYYYRVRATNVAGDSLYSPVASVTTPQIPIAAVPVLTATSSGLDVHLTTTATARASSYPISASKNGAAFAVIATPIVALGAALDYHDTNVADGDVMIYKVQASNGGGTSGFSNTQTLNIVASPIDPITVYQQWYDGLVGGLTNGSSIATITAQGTLATIGITINGNNAIFRKSAPVLNNIGYFENTLTSGRFTLNSTIAARDIMIVGRYRGIPTLDNTYASTGLFSLAGGGTNKNWAAGPSDMHQLLELFSRIFTPGSDDFSSVLIDPATEIRFNYGTPLGTIPATQQSWAAGGTGWITPATKQLAAPKDPDWVIITFKLASALSIDTFFNVYGIPNTALPFDVAAIGVSTTALTATQRAGAVAFVKNRYGLSTSPQTNIYLGDSMFYGGGVVGNNGYKNITVYTEQNNNANGLLSGAVCLNIGSGPLDEAGTTGTLAYMIETYWAAAIRDPHRKKQVAIIGTGANDIVALGGRTGAQIYANDLLIIAYLRSLGFDKIIRVSIFATQSNGTAPYDATNAETQRQAHTALWNANHSSVDYWLDTTGDAKIGQATSYISFPTYFNDWIHYTDVGNAYYATLLGPAIRSVS